MVNLSYIGFFEFSDANCIYNQCSYSNINWLSTFLTAFLWLILITGYFFAIYLFITLPKLSKEAFYCRYLIPLFYLGLWLGFSYLLKALDNYPAIMEEL